MKIVLKNFRVVDEETDMPGRVIIEDGIITDVQSGSAEDKDAAMIINGASFSSPDGAFSGDKLPVLMPAFVDLHAHFRDPGFPDKEVLESGSLAAAAGGFATVVCMANTRPVIDSIEKAAALKERSDALGLIDLYPVMSLTRGMEGKELSGISALPLRRESGGNAGGRKEGDGKEDGLYIPLMLSEDGKDLADDALFLAAMKEAKRIGIPISCHCDYGGDEAEAAKKAGQKRSVWSRIEENNAVRRVIELGHKAGCHIHIAHVSTKEAVEMIRQAKAANNRHAIPADSGAFTLTCEVMPHNLSLTEEDAAKLGEETWGRVNPPLHLEEDRKALVQALADGTIDAIATDHAPHSRADKEAGVPGFSGFETAFAAAYTELVRLKGAGPIFDLKRLSSLMSASPARLLGFDNPPPGPERAGLPFRNGAQKRGRILPGYRADLVIVDTDAPWIVNPEKFKTRGKNSPFAGRELFGKVLMTIHSGRVVFERPTY